MPTTSAPRVATEWVMIPSPQPTSRTRAPVMSAGSAARRMSRANSCIADPWRRHSAYQSATVSHVSVIGAWILPTPVGHSRLAAGAVLVDGEDTDHRRGGGGG